MKTPFPSLAGGLKSLPCRIVAVMLVLLARDAHSQREVSESGPVLVGLVGHSLVNHTIPWMLERISQDKGKPVEAFEQIVNGSPLSYNWKNHAAAEVDPEGGYGDLHEELARRKPGFGHVILTERVAIGECIRWEDTPAHLINWRNRVLEYNPGARVYFYSTWVGFHEGEWWKDIPDDATWRKRTLADGRLFEETAAKASAHPRSAKGKPIRMVPGHRAMVLLFDELQSDRLPWLGDNIRAVFADGIHLNATGHYYIACVMYASIFDESPEGATGQIAGRYGEPLTNLTDDQARALQRLAWKAVSGSNP